MYLLQIHFFSAQFISLSLEVVFSFFQFVKAFVVIVNMSSEIILLSSGFVNFFVQLKLASLVTFAMLNETFFCDF